MGLLATRDIFQVKFLSFFFTLIFISMFLAIIALYHQMHTRSTCDYKFLKQITICLYYINISEEDIQQYIKYSFGMRKHIITRGNTYRGSYISAHVLLNLLKELSEACRAFYLFFLNEFNEFNNTGARMLDSFDHMKLKILKNCIFGVKLSIFCHLLRNVIMDVITLRY